MDNPLPSLAPPPNFSIVGTKKVPNVFPTTAASYRLAIIGESPGTEEESHGIPFCGPSGNELNRHLASVGISRSACFIGNICQHRPPGNDIQEWLAKKDKVADSRVLSGWEELQSQLKSFNPSCILALGNTPLFFLTGKSGILNFRGSILQTQWGKVVPSVHPAFLLHGENGKNQYKWWPLLRHDCRRALEEASSTTLSLPNRNL